MRAFLLILMVLQTPIVTARTADGGCGTLDADVVFQCDAAGYRVVAIIGDGHAANCDPHATNVIVIVGNDNVVTC